MSGIGNTIETDLVGEYVELWDLAESGRSYDFAMKLRCRGLVRAVTSQIDKDHSVHMLLWIELRTEADANLVLGRFGREFEVGVGDILRYSASASSIIRLIKT